MLGVLGGALLGARILTRAERRWLRPLFTAIVVVIAVEMLYKGFTGAHVTRDSRALAITTSSSSIGRLLQFGVLDRGDRHDASAARCCWCSTAAIRSALPNVSGRAGDLESIVGIVRAALASFNSDAIVQLGLCCSSPRRWRAWRSRWSRSRCSAIATYVVITSIVLRLLLYGLVFGKA